MIRCNHINSIFIFNKRWRRNFSIYNFLIRKYFNKSNINRSNVFIFVLFFKLLKALILGRWYWARIKYCQIDRLDYNFDYCFAYCSILGFNYDWILILCLPKKLGNFIDGARFYCYHSLFIYL